MPIKLKTALMSDMGFKDEWLQKMESIINDVHEDILDTITCHIKIDKDEKTSIRAIYKDEKDTQIIVQDSCDESDILISLVEEVIKKYEIQTQCDHTWLRPITPDGDEIPDGRAICNKCSYSSAKELSVIPNKTLVKMSSSNEYVAKYNWGKTFIQGGDSGIVLGKASSYNTAFIEVFPTIGEHSTFIRGEGKTVREAEENAMLKVKRTESCSQHIFTRKVNGTHRTDGCGVCTECGLFSSNALDPETICFMCNKPSKKDFKDKHVCLSDYYSLSLDEVIKEETDRQAGYRKEYKNFGHDITVNEIEWKKYWEFKIVHKLQEFLSPLEIENHSSKVDHMVRHMQHLISRIFYTKGTRLLDRPDYPLKEDPCVETEILDHLDLNKAIIISYIMEKTKAQNSIFIPEHYFKKHN